MSRSQRAKRREHVPDAWSPWCRPVKRGSDTCNYPHLSTQNQCLAGFVQIVSLCDELFEGPPRQVILLGSNIDRSRNYNGPYGWSEMWVIASV
jgi:hypothetical protein